MNVAIVSALPKRPICDKMEWVADGFRQSGHAVRRCYTISDVIVADRESDLLILDHKAAGLSASDLADLATRRRAVWIQWWRDLLAFAPSLSLADQPYVQDFRRLLQSLDRVLVKERSLVPGFAELKIHARWFDQACPADMPACEHPERPEWDVLVLGSAYPQRRQDAKALADAGFRVLWCSLPSGSIPPGCQGHPWVHPVNELPALASRCGVVLGVDYRTDLPGYTSDRTYLAAGMGSAYIARSIDYGIDSATPNSAASELASWLYFDNGSLIAACRTALADRDERERRGYAARKIVMDKHTYKHRAEELAAMVQREFQACAV